MVNVGLEIFQFPCFVGAALVDVPIGCGCDSVTPAEDGAPALCSWGSLLCWCCRRGPQPKSTEAGLPVAEVTTAAVLVPQSPVESDLFPLIAFL